MSLEKLKEVITERYSIDADFIGGTIKKLIFCLHNYSNISSNNQRLVFPKNFDLVLSQFFI